MNLSGFCVFVAKNIMKQKLIYLSCLLPVFFLVIQFAYSTNEPSQSISTPKTIGQTFDGEELFYNISFFPFPNAAWGEIQFQKNPARNGYIITLEAKTRYLIRIFTLMRKDIYRSYVEEVDGGKRLRAYRFEKEVSRLGKTTRKITTADYITNTLHWEKWESGNRTATGEQSFPATGKLDDPLVAFYNLRYGVYGQVDYGKTILVDSIPTGKHSGAIKIEVASEEITARERKDFANPKGRDYLLNAGLDKEMFETAHGKIRIWLAKDNWGGYGPKTPTYGVVKGVLLLGDVTGILKPKKEKQ